MMARLSFRRMFVSDVFVGFYTLGQAWRLRTCEDALRPSCHCHIKGVDLCRYGIIKITLNRVGRDSRDSVVNTVTRLRAEHRRNCSSITGKEELFLSHSVHSGPVAPPASHSVGIDGISSRCKMPGAWSWMLTSIWYHDLERVELHAQAIICFYEVNKNFNSK
jgi:hypothetical protein